MMRFLAYVVSSVASGKSDNLKFSYTSARIVPVTSNSCAGDAFLIPTLPVSSTKRDGFVSSPTWKNGLLIALPLISNLIASIPSSEVDVTLFEKLTGPLNSDGKF